MRRGLLLVLMLAGLVMRAHAAPPPAGTPDAQIMRGFEDWIRNQTNASGRNCCNISDGRPLDQSELRIKDGHYQVFYATRHWLDGTDQWIDVPDGALLPQVSPAGYAIAWITGGRVDCLALAGAV